MKAYVVTTGVIFAILVVVHFWRLDAQRQFSGFDLAPIGYVALVAYQQLTGQRLSPWEVRMIELLDSINLQWYRNRQAVLFTP